MLATYKFKHRLIISFLLLSQAGFSQQNLVPQAMDSINDYQIVSWTTENGLPQNSVNDIIQTTDGYIWLATYGGLVRFDGQTFKTFHIGNTSGLESNRLKTLLESNSGGLWIGHENGGVSIFNDGKFETPRALDSLNHEFVEDFCDDTDGNVWIGTGKGLYKYNGKEILKLDDKDGLPANDVMRLFQNPSGGIYATTGGHYSQPALSYVFDEQVDVLSSYPKSLYFNILDLNSRGELWLAYRDRIVLYKDGKLERTIEYSNEKGGKVQCFYIDADGNYWLGSDKGLIMIPAEELQNDDDSITVSVRSFDVPPLKKNTRRIIQDNEGNIWVGSDGSGLTMLRKRSVQRFFSPIDEGNQSYGELTTDGDGGMWFSPLCDGLSHYKAGSFSKFTPITDCVDALSNDPENQRIVYVGNETKLGKIEDFQYTVITDLADIKPNEDQFYWQISAIQKEKDGAFWLGTKGSGVIVFNDLLLNHYTANDHLTGDWIYTICRVGDDEIWIGTDGGISIFSGDDIRQITIDDGLVNGAIRSIYEDSEGVIWVGSYGGGLSKISGHNITNYTSQDGLSENVISRIREDENGNLWMLGNLGLSMVRKQQFYDLDNRLITELATLPFGYEEGMEEGNGAGGVVKTDDGLTWWPTIQGIAGINIDLDYLDANPPTMVIQEIKISNQVIPGGARKMVTLEESQRDIEVNYAGLKYASPDKIRYRYMLDGYDNGWRLNGNRRTINYTNLDPGNYILKLQASNLNGAWGANYVSLRIKVKPRLHQETWFRVLFIMIILGLAWLIIGARERYLVRKRIELGEIIRSRTAELNLKNDKLESQKCELEQALNSLKETQKRLIQSEKMASLGVLSAGVAHEINNPLQFIQNGLDIIQQSRDDLETLREKLPVSLEIIENGISRASAIVSSLTQFSRINDRFDEKVEIKEVLDNCLIMMGSSLKPDVTIKKEYASSLVCEGNEGMLHQAFLNILMNANQAIQEKGTILVSAQTNHERKIEIAISDSGIGISQESKALIFDPFFTTKPPGQGTGLGLSITYDIIRQHQGTIAVHSEGAGKGTVFTVFLPCLETVEQKDQSTNTS